MSSLYGSDALGGVVNIITKKIGQKWHGSVTVDSTIQEHRDRGDTYNGQFFTSGPLIDGVLGMKAYGSLAKRRALKDLPAGMETSSLPGHQTKIMTLPQATVLIARTGTPTRWIKTVWNGKTTR